MIALMIGRVVGDAGNGNERSFGAVEGGDGRMGSGLSAVLSC